MKVFNDQEVIVLKHEFDLADRIAEIGTSEAYDQLIDVLESIRDHSRHIYESCFVFGDQEDQREAALLLAYCAQRFIMYEPRRASDPVH